MAMDMGSAPCPPEIMQRDRVTERPQSEVGFSTVATSVDRKQLHLGHCHHLSAEKQCGKERGKLRVAKSPKTDLVSAFQNSHSGGECC